MSLVGTRPILQDELEQYELHHRASNRDYEFLIRTIEKTEYQLVLACDMLNEESHNNIEVRKNTFGKEMLRYMRNRKHNDLWK